MRRAIPAVAVLIGCAPRLQTAEDEPISAAWLEYFDLSSIVMLGGVVDGEPARAVVRGHGRLARPARRLGRRGRLVLVTHGDGERDRRAPPEAALNRDVPA